MNIKEQLIEKTKKWVNEKGIFEIDFYLGIECWDREARKVRGGEMKQVYVVSFKTNDYVEHNDNGEIISLFEGMYCSAYYDAETLVLLFILKPHGYIEPDGSSSSP